ncbi:MAG: hypothetical protein ACOYMB_03635 [Patescibacteria group bacterium]
MKKIRIILNFLVAALAAIILLNYQKVDYLPLDEKPYFTLFLLMAVIILALSISKIYIVFHDLILSFTPTMIIIVLAVIMGIFVNYFFTQSMGYFLDCSPIGIIIISCLDYLTTIEK